MEARESTGPPAAAIPIGVERHYGIPGLWERIEEALRGAGIDPVNPRRDQIAMLEEFHIGGVTATRELARAAGLEGLHILDIGCGVGGPARTLVEEFHCRVTGVDLTDEYCRVARILNARLGLSDKIEIRRADALSLPVADGSFDAVVTEHVAMNIPDKMRLFAEVRRVLAPRGVLALYEICAGPVRPHHLPVPWAEHRALSLLETPDTLREDLEMNGFRIVSWEDVTPVSIERFRVMSSTIVGASPDASPPVAMNLLMGERATEKATNVLRNLEEDRIRVIRGVARR